MPRFKAGRVCEPRRRWQSWNWNLGSRAAFMLRKTYGLEWTQSDCVPGCSCQETKMFHAELTPRLCQLHTVSRGLGARGPPLGPHRVHRPLSATKPPRQDLQGAALDGQPFTEVPKGLGQVHSERIRITVITTTAGALSHAKVLNTWVLRHKVRCVCGGSWSLMTTLRAGHRSRPRGLHGLPAAPRALCESRENTCLARTRLLQATPLHPGTGLVRLARGGACTFQCVSEYP